MASDGADEGMHVDTYVDDSADAAVDDPTPTAGGAGGSDTPSTPAGDSGILHSTSSFSHRKIEDLYDFPLKPLGKGMYGEVVQGRHKGTGEPVAIKIIRRRGMDKKQLKTVVLEIEAMKTAVNKVKSPNIVGIIDAFETKSRLFIVLEFCPGGELFDRIVAKQHFSEEDASVIMRKLTIAIRDLHKAGIVHRDMKPENILLTTPGDDAEVKITDFGLSKIEGAEDLFGVQKVGSPGYISPQVLQDPPLYDEAGDVWALGVILYIMIVGYPPFYGSDRQMYGSIRAGRYQFQSPYWDRVSDTAKDLIRKILVVDPKERITTEGILAHPWITEQQTEENMDGLVEELTKFNAKRKFRAAVVASVWSVRMDSQSALSGLVSKPFSKEEVTALRSAFHAKKSGGSDGRVTREQFADVMSSIGFGDLPLDKMFSVFDVDDSGTVDYKEFLSGLSALKLGHEEALKMAFETFDADGSGFISSEELARVLYSIADNEVRGALLTAGRIVEVFEALDTNKDGRISYEEFQEGVHKDDVLRTLVLEPFNASVRLGTAVSPTKEIQMHPVAEEEAHGEEEKEGAGGAGGAPAAAAPTAEPAVGAGAAKKDRCAIQ